MKIDRLLGIITTLLQRDKVTAPELAQKFEVSRRTIMRDIDDICKAGIPVITWQGGAGGISIAEGYKLDKSVLTVDELNSIVAGLGSIRSVSEASKVERLIAKLAPRKEGIVSMRDSILIDLSSHYKTSLSQKIDLLKSAIGESRLVAFDYYSSKGVENRIVEPCFILFKWSSWYLYGYCRSKNAFRLFKLNRLWKLSLCEEAFVPREIPESDVNLDNRFSDENRVTILFDKSAEFLLVDEYGPESYQEQADGRLLLTMGYTNKEYFISWILGFGDRARVTEPSELASEIAAIAKNMVDRYEHDT